MMLSTYIVDIGQPLAVFVEGPPVAPAAVREMAEPK